MGILIDPPAWPAYGRLWSHLVSDESHAELHQFAAAHSIPRRGFDRDHYDVPADAYDRLVAAGAQPVSSRELVRRLSVAGLRRRKADTMARRRPGAELLRPPRLRPGDQVAVVAGAGVVPASRLAAGVAVLEGWGLRVRVDERVLDAHDPLTYLAGSDQARARSFHAAWTDADIAGVFLARGGYGTQRMLDLLDWRRLAEADPKLVVGFSDVTALHEALAAKLGLASVLGHLVTSLATASAASAERLRAILMGEEFDVLGGFGGTCLTGGVADGVLVGGNLALLAADVGTSTSRPAAGGLVVLEDVEEEPYRIDRYLTQLLRSGWFDGVRGIVLGAFTDCGNPELVDAVLTDRLAGLGVPVVMGVDLGHTPSSATVPLGVAATLDADAVTLRLHGPAVA